MDADRGTLRTAIYCTADDLLPESKPNARRKVTDAELVTLCVAQASMGIPSDRRFPAVARRHLVHLFPQLPRQPAYWKRRRRLADAIEWLMGVFAVQNSDNVTENVLFHGADHPRAVVDQTQALSGTRITGLWQARV